MGAAVIHFIYASAYPTPTSFSDDALPHLLKFISTAGTIPRHILVLNVLVSTPVFLFTWSSLSSEGRWAADELGVGESKRSGLV
jgi:hypothetical protein